MKKIDLQDFTLESFDYDNKEHVSMINRFDWDKEIDKYIIKYDDSFSDQIAKYEEKVDLEKWDLVVQTSEQTGTAASSAMTAATSSAMKAFERRLENVETSLDEHLEHDLSDSFVPRNKTELEHGLLGSNCGKKG